MSFEFVPLGNLKGPRGDPAFNADPQRLAPSTDTATVTIDDPADYSYNRSYTRGTTSVPPPLWPVDNGQVTVGISSMGYEYQVAPSSIGEFTHRFMCDGGAFYIYHYVPNVNCGFMVYVDGAPLSLSPYETATVKSLFTEVVFDAGPKTRLIEIVSRTWFYTVFCKKPYKMWKPDPLTGPKVFVVGDSYCQPNVCANTGSGFDYRAEQGIWQGIAPSVGLREVLVNGIGGTGYLNPGSGGPSAGTYLSRLPANASFNPDVLIAHGGGCNDMYIGAGVPDIITAVVNYFTAARAALPKAKLVFIEGFSPPGFTPSVYNPNYVDIREGAQAALMDIGVYYIDVATTEPWINGEGYVGSPSTDGENSTTYIGADSFHPTTLGHRYISERMAPKLRRVLRDNGTLVNALI